MSQPAAPQRLTGHDPARRCPNCGTQMKYIEFFDGHRCPSCITIVKPAPAEEEARTA